MKCLVTGATGFIGRALCARLEAMGAQYLALSTDGRALPDGHATVAVDFASSGVPAELLEGVEIVFHLAGIAHQRAQAERYELINHRATVELAAACAAAGVCKFIFLSSVKAMGLPEDARARTEEQYSLPSDAYGLGKRAAELELLSAYDNSEMALLIVRPALVYGSGVRGNLQTLATAVRNGVPRPPAMGGRSMIARTDLVELLIQVARQNISGAHVWIACDGQSYSACDIYDLMRAALGKAPGRRWLPVAVWRILCAMRDIYAKPSDGSTFDKIFATELYDCSALTRDCGWQPSLQLADEVDRIMGTGSDVDGY
ncbi:MAG: NAD-dependent epimerase/dehydratase family protein [Halioglobus sp.]